METKQIFAVGGVAAIILIASWFAVKIFLDLFFDIHLLIL